MAVTLLEAARSERPRRGQGDDSALLATSSGCVRASLVLPTSLSSERAQHVAEGRIHLDEFPSHIGQDHTDGSIVKGLLEAVMG